jgi:hypothetical protein
MLKTLLTHVRNCVRHPVEHYDIPVELRHQRLCITDFDLALANSAMSVFNYENGMARGFHHYVRAIYAKLVEMGHGSKYAQDKPFKIAVRLVMWIPALPPDDIVVFAGHMHSVFRDKFAAALPWLEYVQRTYMSTTIINEHNVTTTNYLECRGTHSNPQQLSFFFRMDVTNEQSVESIHR